MTGKVTLLTENDTSKPGVTLLIDPEILEQEAQALRELEWKLEDLKGQEVICEIIAPNGEVLEITNYDYRKYKRGTIRKFVKEHKND